MNPSSCKQNQKVNQQRKYIYDSQTRKTLNYKSKLDSVLLKIIKPVNSERALLYGWVSKYRELQSLTQY